MDDAELPLVGKVAVVTGSSGFLGGHVMQRFAELGANCYGLDIVHGDERQPPVEATSLPAHVTKHLTCDLGSAQDRLRVCRLLEESETQIDIIVNNAAQVETWGPSGLIRGFVDETDEAFARALEVNLVAPFSLTRNLLPLLLRAQSPVIVNVASIHGIVAPVPQIYEGLEMTSHAAYAASKGGLIQLTRYLASMLGPQVRVNAVAPGGIGRQQPDEFVSRYAERTLLGRMARVSEIVQAIEWLSSEASSYVTGQVLVVDGGWTSV